jgi:hypothetical protein
LNVISSIHFPTVPDPVNRHLVAAHCEESAPVAASQTEITGRPFNRLDVLPSRIGRYGISLQPFSDPFAIGGRKPSQVADRSARINE